MSAFFPGAFTGILPEVFPLLALAGVALLSCVTFLCVALRRSSAAGVSQTVYGTVVPGVTCTVGSFTLFVSNVFSSFFLLALGIVLTGVSSAAFFLGWARMYGRDGARSALLLVPSSFVCGAVVDVPLVLMTSVPRAVIFALLPLASSVLLYRMTAPAAAAEVDLGVRASKPERETDPSSPQALLQAAIVKKTLGVPHSFLVGVFFFVIANGYSQYIALFTSTSGETSGVLLQFVRGGAALLLALAVLKFRAHSLTVFRLSFMVAIGGFLMIPVAFADENASSVYMSSFVINIGYTWFDVLVWIVVCEIGRGDGGFDPRPVAVVRIFMALGQALGLFAGYLVIKSACADAVFIRATTVCSYLLVAACVLVLSNESNIWSALRASLRDGAYVPVEPGIRALLEYSVARFGMVYGFTSREMDVFGKLLQGRSVKKIAEELGISENTVVSHVRHMYHKTDCHSRQELIDLYMQEEPRE